MEEKTLFKLARAITDTGTDTVSSEGGTVTYRITSLKRKLVNGKIVSTSTPSCTLGSASVSWATWGGVTVGDGYLDVKIKYSENTGSSRSTTLIFDQNGSGNKINLTVTQGSYVTYTGYIRIVSSTLPLGSGKGNTSQMLVIAYLKGSDGSKKPKTPNVSAPDWCAVSVAPEGTLENHYMISLAALLNNQTGENRLGFIFLTCGDAELNIQMDQLTTTDKPTVYITISVFKSPTSNTTGSCEIKSNQIVASPITLRLQIQYGVSSGDVRDYKYTLAKGSAISRNNFAIQNEANPEVVRYSYSPLEDTKYIYSVRHIISSVG